MRELLVIALVLACPLMMIMMMRGGHGHGRHGGHGRDAASGGTTDDLRRRRDELDALIAEREQSARSAPVSTDTL